ncbi:MAG: DMT family transporter [Gammaproteobacteria bacterium]
MGAPHATQFPPIAFAVAWMGGALVSFLSMGVAGRELSVELQPHHSTFYRNALCLILLLPFVLRAGWKEVSTQLAGRHIARNAVHYFGQWCWLYALGVLPFAEVFAIEFTTPIWTALLASFFLREPLTASRLSAIALGFVGILVILRPGLAIVDPASFVALAAALGYAAAYVLTKKLVVTESPLTILIWMNAVQLPIGGLLSIGNLTVPGLALWPWIFVLGVAGLTAHYCISRALTLADATVVVPLDFLRLPLAIVTAWLLYDEALSPFVFAGVLFILAGNWINVKRG